MRGQKRERGCVHAHTRLQVTVSGRGVQWHSVQGRMHAELPRRYHSVVCEHTLPHSHTPHTHLTPPFCPQHPANVGGPLGGRRIAHRTHAHTHTRTQHTSPSSDRPRQPWGTHRGSGGSESVFGAHTERAEREYTQELGGSAASQHGWTRRQGGVHPPGADTDRTGKKRIPRQPR